jgi:hypothetical protein
MIAGEVFELLEEIVTRPSAWANKANQIRVM